MLVKVFPRNSDDSEIQTFSSDDFDIVILLNEDQKELIRSMRSDSSKMISGDSSAEAMYEMLDDTGYFDAECSKCGKEFLRAEAPTELCARCFEESS